MSACPRCGGTGFLIVDKDGREFAQRCACRRAAPATPQDAARQTRIPPRYEHCSLATFDPRTPSHARALEYAMQFCSRYPFENDDEGLGLLISGDPGVGKTHLGVAVLRELAEMKGVRGCFWDFQQLMREIRNSYDPETKLTELEVLNPVIEAPLLVLDDLGAWRITDWMGDTLFQILNSRYLARRPTVVTTNLRDVSVEEAKRADPLHRREFLIDRIGHRLRSRLAEMCLQLKLEGDDFRYTRQVVHQSAILGTADSKDPRR